MKKPKSKHSVQVTVNTPYYMVIDDFLSKKDFQFLWNYFQVEKFFRVDDGLQDGQWLIEDGGTLRGPTIGYKKKWHAQYPTGTAIDLVMDAILENVNHFVRLLGIQGKDWEDFTAFPTLYQAGTGLHWHRDVYTKSGSYTLYAHPEWNIEWGGEMFLAYDKALLEVPDNWGAFLNRPKECMGSDTEISLSTHLDNRCADKLLMKRGHGSFVIPKPNRLVVIHGGVPHKVNKVHLAAGSKARASISGFFQRIRK